MPRMPSSNPRNEWQVEPAHRKVQTKDGNKEEGGKRRGRGERRRRRRRREEQHHEQQQPPPTNTGWKWRESDREGKGPLKGGRPAKRRDQMQVRQINTDGKKNAYDVLTSAEDGVQVMLLQDISMIEKEIESLTKSASRLGWTAYGMEAYRTEKDNIKGGGS